MPESRGRKRERSKPQISKGPKPKAKGRSKLRLATELVLGTASIVGAVIAALTLLPRITVEMSDEFSRATRVPIMAVVTNINFVPLDNVAVFFHVCDLVISDNDNPLPPPPKCSIAKLSQLGSKVAYEKHRLWADEKWSVSLDINIANPEMRMRRADFGITVAFNPLWIPWRRQKTFAFRSETGREGKLYWRSYPLDD